MALNCPSKTDSDNRFEKKFQKMFENTKKSFQGFKV